MTNNLKQSNAQVHELAYFQNRTVNEQCEQQKQVKHCIVVFLLNAKYIHRVDYIAGILLSQLIILLVPRIEVKLENVLHDDQHLLKEHTHTHT